MADKKEDRRVRITKRAIKESLVELMQDYPISKISVKMICEAADINRSTFYAHYADQYDLLKKLQMEVVDGIKQHIVNRSFTQQSQQTVPVIVQILEYAKENALLFKALLSENGDSSFQNDLAFLAQQKTIEEIRDDKRLGGHTSKYIELFAISGVLSIVREWLECGCADEPSYLADLLTTLLFQGVAGIYPN